VINTLKARRMEIISDNFSLMAKKYAIEITAVKDVNDWSVKVTERRLFILKIQKFILK
jgi:hypothetical protein